MERFSLIELLVVMVIIGILLPMLLFVITMDREKDRYRMLTDKYGKSCTFEEFKKAMHGSDRSEDIKKDVFKLYRSEIELEDSKSFSHWLDRAEEKYKRAYDSWKKYTRSDISYDDFAVLYCADLIEEYRWRHWRIITGNPNNLSEEQYYTLVIAGQIDLGNK